MPNRVYGRGMTQSATELQTPPATKTPSTLRQNSLVTGALQYAVNGL